MIPTQNLLSEVFEIIREMTGGGPKSLSAETFFFADLGLSSIDAIVLGERLEERFGRPLRFTEVLTDFARAGRDDVTLGEVAAFVQFQLDQPVEETLQRLISLPALDTDLPKKPYNTCAPLARIAELFARPPG